jgi:N-carbamoylputrescine amidase
MSKLTVTGIQMGPYPGSYRSNMEEAVAALECAVAEYQPDFVCFSEMMTGPYFCRVYDDSYFEFAEPVPGPTTELFAAEARKHGVNIVATAFEKRGDNYYNTSMLISSEGDLIGKYRKSHVPSSSSPIINSDEKYYFTPGDELPVFHVGDVTVGMLICFDRSFPETFRVLALKGAEIVFVPVCSWGVRADNFQEELRVRATENGLFVVAVNKAGFEQIEGEDEGRDHFGRSCIIGPMGETEAAIDAEPWGIVSATIDLDKRKLLKEAVIDWLAERRPELYGDLGRH